MNVDNYKMFIPEIYDEFFFNHDDGRKKHQRQVDFIESLRFIKELPKKILDLGCGTGNHLYLFSQDGYTGVGIDLREDMLECARRKIPQSQITFVQQNMLDFSFNNEFGVVSCLFTALNYLPTREDSRKVMKKSLEHLVPGGFMIIDTRYAIHQPKGVKIKKNPNGIVEIGTWELDKANPENTVYRVLLAKEGNEEHSFFKFDEQKLNFMNPYSIASDLREVGFRNVEIYEDFDLGKKVEQEHPFWKATMVAHK